MFFKKYKIELKDIDKIFVNQGDEVKKGAMIAQLGNSEAAYPMLRFQLRKNGQPLRAEALSSLFN